MSSEGDRTGKAGIVVAPEDAGSVDKLVSIFASTKIEPETCTDPFLSSL